jgi:hypothetical protein
MAKAVSAGCDTTHLIQDALQWQVLVNTVMNLLAPYRAESFLNSGATVSFSIRTPLHVVS